MEGVEWSVLDISGDKNGEIQPFGQVILANIDTFSNSILEKGKDSNFHFSFSESQTFVETPTTPNNRKSILSESERKSILDNLEDVQKEVERLNIRISQNLKLLNSYADFQEIREIAEQELIDTKEYQKKANEQIKSSCTSGCLIY